MIEYYKVTMGEGWKHIPLQLTGYSRMFIEHSIKTKDDSYLTIKDKLIARETPYNLFYRELVLELQEGMLSSCKRQLFDGWPTNMMNMVMNYNGDGPSYKAYLKRQNKYIESIPYDN